MPCFIQLMGGLGNQLFEIATAYAHAQRNSYQLQISPTTNCKRMVYWDSFYPNCIQYKCIDHIQLLPRYNEPHFHYVSIPSYARNLFGYFQSSKYFSEYADEIKTLFTPSCEVRDNMNAKWGHLLTEPHIVMHIRRGDYVALPQFHGILKPSYYVNAVQRMMSETCITKVLVFSDDIEWCKTIGLPESTVYVDESDETIALLLMSQFKHYIISNSSFSWWAVWLGESATLVYAPDRWFGPQGPQDIQDIYESSWVKLST
jgi:hypothetical protein